jgi:hypothetical protein
MSVRVRRRGSKYAVLYRRGGRGFAEEWAGSFKTQREAKVREALVRLELAAGRDPKVALDGLKRQQELGLRRATLRALGDRYMARPDIADSTRRDQQPKLKLLVDQLGAAPQSRLNICSCDRAGCGAGVTSTWDSCLEKSLSLQRLGG